MEKIETPVKQAWLHKAVMIGGKTESTLTKTKLPFVTQMGWNKSASLFILETDKFGKHYLPAAAVNHSIGEDL